MTEHSDEWVCTYCYIAHHYGYRAVDRELTEPERVRWVDGDPSTRDLYVFGPDENGRLWVREFFAGDTDTPCHLEPLNRLDGYELSDNTCSNHDGSEGWDDDLGENTCTHCGRDGYEDGLDEFSWRQCGGCGSTLGGSRFRLACWPISVPATPEPTGGPPPTNL